MEKEIFDEIVKKGPEPVYLFVGDEFLVKEQVGRLVDAVLEPASRAMNLIVIDGNRLDTSQLSLELSTPSLFGAVRVIVVDRADIFVGKADRRKIVQRVMDRWKAGDRQAAVTSLGQLLNLAGMDSEDLFGSSDWMNELVGTSVDAQEADVLTAVAQSFVEEGKQAGGAADEVILEELIRSEFPAGTVLVFTAPAVDRRTKLFKAVEKRGKVIECAVRQEKWGGGIERSFFENRVKDTLGGAGKKISSGALEKIYERSGKSMRSLHNELEKLIGYVGKRDEITSKDVERVFTDFHEAAFYELNSSIREGDLKKCLNALHEHGKISEHPLQTLAMITNEFRKLMLARELLFTVFKTYWKPGMPYKSFQSVLKEDPEFTGRDAIYFHLAEALLKAQRPAEAGWPSHARAPSPSCAAARPPLIPPSTLARTAANAASASSRSESPIGWSL